MSIQLQQEFIRLGNIFGVLLCDALMSIRHIYCAAFCALLGVQDALLLIVGGTYYTPYNHILFKLIQHSPLKNKARRCFTHSNASIPMGWNPQFTVKLPLSDLKFMWLKPLISVCICLILNLIFF